MALVHPRLLEPTRMASLAMADVRRPASGPVLDLTGALAPGAADKRVTALLFLVRKRAALPWTEEEAREAGRLVAELGPEVGDG